MTVQEFEKKNYYEVQNNLPHPQRKFLTMLSSAVC